MILLTTSRRPTKGIQTSCHDLTRSILNIVRISRGKLSVTEVAEKALENNTDKVIIVDRWKGGPGKIRFFSVNSTGLNAVPPLIYVRLLAVSLSSEKSNQTAKIAGFLSDFLHVPMLSMKQASVNHQVAMLISFDTAQHIQLHSFFCQKKLKLAPVSLFHMLSRRFKNEGSRGCSLKV